MHLLAAELPFLFWQTEVTVQKVIPKLRLLGTFQHTALFSAGYNFTHQALTLGLKFSMLEVCFRIGYYVLK